jgi:ketosteroid isomerase-like protein
MTAEAELRALHDAWFAAAARKDIDASMAPVHRDVISYEHVAPLAYHGSDAVRAVCQAGLDAAPSVTWTMPDLTIVVRGDLAVTWGINRIDTSDATICSRATRIFQRLDGRWQLIHQHVSFPMDPASGRAVTTPRSISEGARGGAAARRGTRTR